MKVSSWWPMIRITVGTGNSSFRLIPWYLSVKTKISTFKEKKTILASYFILCEQTEILAN